MKLDSKFFIAGHKGLVGSAIIRNLKKKGFTNLIVKDRQEVNLLNQEQTLSFFKKEKPEYVIIAAAKVGGILFNKEYQADFLYENLMIASNSIHAAYLSGVEKLLFLGSSCIYPKFAQQPMTEDSLLTGKLEPTNEGYAIAKIAGLKLCEKYMEQYGKRFISAMPTNLYGPGDNFHPDHSHVIPGLMRRFHEAKVKNQKSVLMWGTGQAKREFLHVDDLAEALYLLMEKYEDSQTINIGTGEDCKIIELAYLLKEVVGYEGVIELDQSKPDGTPRKVLDISKVKNLGWSPIFDLKKGLTETYEWAIENNVF